MSRFFEDRIEMFEKFKKKKRIVAIGLNFYDSKIQIKSNH